MAYRLFGDPCGNKENENERKIPEVHMEHKKTFARKTWLMVLATVFLAILGLLFIGLSGNGNVIYIPPR